MTASTGTVHIDTDFCMEKGIEVISIKDELATLERISSTAEHAVLLTLWQFVKPFYLSAQFGETNGTTSIHRKTN